MGILQAEWSKASSSFKSMLDILSGNHAQPRGWSGTEATVIACEIEPLDLELALLFVPKVTYSFSANGQEFRCTEMIRWTPLFGRSNKILERFGRGAKIRVKHNPANPRMAHFVEN